jgi:hypothetical protein
LLGEANPQHPNTKAQGESSMQTEHLKTAHSLYALYETLPNDIQQAFLQELLQHQQEKLENLAFYLACQQAKDEDNFFREAESQAFINSLPQ